MRKLKVSEEDRAEYLASTASDDAIIKQALSILAKRIKRPGALMDSPTAVKDYLRLHMAGLEAERFDVLFLDVKNRVIKHEQMFTGTLASTSVYPREVVKAALSHNASAVMMAHNHPSGEPEPSEADHRITRALQQALALVDVRTLDHFIVAGDKVHSFAEHGQI